MKRKMISVLTTAAALTVMAAQPMTAMAASWAYTNVGSGQYKVLAGGKQNVSLKELMGKLNLNCDIPGSNIPDNSLPAPEFPVPDGPDQPSLPMPELPGQPNLPMPELPGQPNLPMPELPGQPSLPTPELPGQPGGSQDAWTQQVVDLVNSERAKAGLPALSVNSQAAEAAGVRAGEIARSFSHTRPDGRDFSTALKEAGVSYSSAGENIAYGQKTPQEVMDQWMNSAGHRANILNPNFTAIGVGNYQNGSGTNYWTQLFIR